MSDDDYRDAEHPRPCDCCGRYLKAVSQRRCYECETGATPPSRWLKLYDWEPVAVVFPARYVTQPQVVWYDAITYGHRQRQIHLACRIASLTNGEVRLLSEDTFDSRPHPTAPTERQAAHARRTPTPAVESVAAGEVVPRG